MNKKNLIGSLICAVLTAFGIVASIISLIKGHQSMWYCDCGSLIILALIICYALFWYKKPHCNMLKYILLLHAVLRLVGIFASVPEGDTIGIISRTVGVGLTCYIAGRLANIKENIILMAIATIVLGVELVSDIVTGISAIGVVTPFVAWIDVCVAYFLRYKEHKEAGL